MLKKIIGWTLYIIGYPFHKCNIFLGRYLEAITYISMMPCILFLVYQAVSFIIKGSYKTNDPITTIIGFIFVAMIWIPCALLGFSLYSFVVWIMLSAFYTITSILELLYSFSRWLLGRDYYEKRKVVDIILKSVKEILKLSKLNHTKTKDTNYEKTASHDNWQNNKKQEYHSYQKRQSGFNRNINEIDNARRLFGLDTNFDLYSLKKARNNLAKKYHPDSGYTGNDEMAQRINIAYKILKPYARKPKT